MAVVVGHHRPEPAERLGGDADAQLREVPLFVRTFLVADLAGPENGRHGIAANERREALVTVASAGRSFKRPTRA